MTTAAASSSDPFSPRSSAGSSVYSGESGGSSCLPRRRIRCSKSKITVGERQYNSASDALQAYLTQFDEDAQNGVDGNQANGGHEPNGRDIAVSSELGRVNGVSVNHFSKADGPKRDEGSTNTVATGKQDCVDKIKEVGKGLAGSGLVLAANGIAVAGTKEDVEDLLTSKVSPKLQEEVTDTLREVKLRRLLKQAALKSKNQTKTGLQEEVEAALIRSAELLEKVTREDISSTKSTLAEVSTVSSCNSSTLNSELEALLLGDASATCLREGLKGDDSAGIVSPASLPSTPRSPPQYKSGHTYSYHTSRPSRSKRRPTPGGGGAEDQSQPCAPVTYNRRSRGDRRHRASSIDSLLPTPTPSSDSLNTTLQLLLNHRDSPNSKRDALISPSSSDSAPSNQSDPTDLLRQIRSRSMSPATARGHRSPRINGSSSSSTSFCGPSYPSGPDWVHQLDESVRKSVPSWVGDMSHSEISESAWVHQGLLEDEYNRRPAVPGPQTGPKVPSWVGQAEVTGVSDAPEGSQFLDTSRPPLVPMMSTPIKPIKNGSIRQNGAGRVAISVSDVTNCSSRPGLNLSDLNLSIAQGTSQSNNSGSSKHVTFTDSPAENRHKLASLCVSPPPTADGISSPLQHQAGRVESPSLRDANPSSGTRQEADLTSPRPSRVLDSDYNGESILRNSILPQTARLKKSMDNFRVSSENLRRRAGSSSASSECSGGSSSGGGTSHPGKACSSLDTVALLAGKTLTRSQSRGETKAGPGPTSDHGSSTDGLDGDRPWERMLNTIKAPVPVEEEVGSKSNGLTPQLTMENTLSGGKQPGSMEALKNMLFKLQAEETSSQENSKDQQSGANQSQQNEGQPSMASIPALENYDFKQEPGGHSLEKALVHLNRLKKLVKTGPSQSGGCEKDSNDAGAKESSNEAS